MDHLTIFTEIFLGFIQLADSFYQILTQTYQILIGV